MWLSLETKFFSKIFCSVLYKVFQILGLYVESSGANDGYDCMIKLNGGENLCKRGRGHNVVVINPLTGNIVSEAFDTYESVDQVFKNLWNLCQDILQEADFIVINVNVYNIM